MKRRTSFALLGLAAAMPLAALAQTPAWPTRPVTVVVPFTPGGGGDTITRMLSLPLGQERKHVFPNLVDIAKS